MLKFIVNKFKISMFLTVFFLKLFADENFVDTQTFCLQGEIMTFGWMGKIQQPFLPQSL